MNYWLDLFTGTTWDEFRAHGATVTGFRPRRMSSVKQVSAGDILLCYMTGVMRWVGAVKVKGPSKDKSAIWSDTDFPVRLEVEPLIILDPEEGIPMEQFEGQLEFYRGQEDRGKFKGFLRASPSRFKMAVDGDRIFKALESAKANPTKRPVDERKLRRVYRAERKQGRKIVSTVVTVPESDIGLAIDSPEIDSADVKQTTLHTEMQYLLLTLGAEMGLGVWVARNDRGKVCNGMTLGSLPSMVEKIPSQFNEATNRTIELIDVLWLHGNAIVAAFEVESTTAVYSGLLRMSDLLALQPNIDIRLFIVAPDERRAKVEQEILRPTFMLREKPLNRICGFLPFSLLSNRVRSIREMNLARSLKPDFLQRMSEYFVGDEE